MKREITKVKDIKVNLPRKWSELSYSGDDRIPQGLDPNAGSFPMYYIKRNENCKFTTLDGELITFQIMHPDNFDFDKELLIVREALYNLTKRQTKIAEYWGEGPPTKQWTPIVDRLIDTYNLSPVLAARVIGAVQAGINDAIIITWFFKYIWDVPRPNQLDQNMSTLICTPRFPSYPSGHSVVSGTAEIILGYFFPPETSKLKKLAEEDSISRLYGGVHFPSDLSEGLRLGRQIGKIVVDVLRGQQDNNQCAIDISIEKDLDANINPLDYKQVIPYPSRVRLCDLPLLPQQNKAEGNCDLFYEWNTRRVIRV